MDRRNRFGKLKVLLVMSMVLACLSMFYVNVGIAATAEPTSTPVTTKGFEVNYRDAVYNMKQTSPLNEEMEEEYVDPLTGNLIVSRTDLHLPGINGLDLNLTRYHTTTNEYLGEIKTNNPNFEYVYMASCKNYNCEKHKGKVGWKEYYYDNAIDTPEKFQVRIYDWLTEVEADGMVGSLIEQEDEAILKAEEEALENGG